MTRWRCPPLRGERGRPAAADRRAAAGGAGAEGRGGPPPSCSGGSFSLTPLLQETRELAALTAHYYDGRPQT